RAHHEGVLNSASLMIGGKAALEAVELAKQNPSLAVGLHLVVVDGPAVLPPERIPHLVNGSGEFPNAPLTLGLGYVFSRSARREVAAEIEAQFERFAATGLPMAHVDGHQHMHMHPYVFQRLLPLAGRFGAGRVRVVRDDLRLALRYSRRRLASKTLGTLVFALLRKQRGIKTQPRLRTYGLLQSGSMTEPYVSLLLQQLHEPAEIYFHPTEGERLDELGPNPGDLTTLLNPDVRRLIEARRLQYGTGNMSAAVRGRDNAAAGFEPAGGVPASLHTGIGSVSLK
ncbi:MAG TPA: ChbG/HpnK family deacetylase, partial [Tepidisphaeraceae bacterium]|nr:ChbG/HpnK family deacetylase [Tepidisphaeraceae bacterium]